MPDKERLEHYSIFKRHFMSNIEIPYRLKKKFVNPTFLRDGIPATVSKISADFLFGEGFLLRHKDVKTEQQLNELYKETGMQTVLYEDALSNSYFGDGVLNAYKEDDEVFLQSVFPGYYYPELHQFDQKRVVAQVFKFEYHKKRGDKIVDYILEVRDNGKIITRKLYEVRKEAGIEKLIQKPLGTDEIGMELKDEEKNEVGMFMSAHTPNLPRPYGFFGISDYQNLTTYFDELNNRFSRNSMTLDNHADPKMQLPDSVADQDGYVDSQKSYFLVNPNSNNVIEPKYIDFNSKIPDALEHVKEILNSILRNAEIPSVLVGMEDSKAESGRALKFRLMRLIAKIQRKQLYYDKTIRHMAAVLFKLKFKKDILPEDITVEFSDGIPTDELEEATLTQVLVTSGLISKEEGIKRTSRLQGEDLDQEIEKVANETSVGTPDPIKIDVGPPAVEIPIEQ